jgi:tetratricopeptide (TPR) repeat protein
MMDKSSGFRLLVVVAMLLFAPVALAGSEDQRRVQIDAAFGALQAKDDSVETFKAEQKIWSLWMQSDNAEQDKLLGSASSAMGLGGYRLADVMLNQLIAQNPAYAEAWNKRATLYYLMGRFEASLADIAKTLDLEPRHFGALSGKGMILVKQGKMNEALKAYEEADAINPHMPGVRAAIKQLKALQPEL